MPVTRSTPNRGGQGTTQSDDAWAEQVQPTNNTPQAGDVQPANNTAQVGDIQPSNNTAQVGELTPAEAGTAQPSTSGTQPNDTNAFNDAKDF